jgi:hypothetical protein
LVIGPSPYKFQHSQHVNRVVALLKRLFTEYEKSSSLSSVGTNVLECHTKDDLFDDYSPPKQISELDWYLESPVMDLNVNLRSPWGRKS